MKISSPFFLLWLCCCCCFFGVGFFDVAVTDRVCLPLVAVLVVVLKDVFGFCNNGEKTNMLVQWNPDWTVTTLGCHNEGDTHISTVNAPHYGPSFMRRPSGFSFIRENLAKWRPIIPNTFSTCLGSNLPFLIKNFLLVLIDCMREVHMRTKLWKIDIVLLNNSHNYTLFIWNIIICIVNIKRSCETSKVIPTTNYTYVFLMDK